MKPIEWQINWESFINSIALDFDKGASDEDLTNKYGGSEVIWEGKITEIKLDEEFSPGVQLEMPKISIPLNNGKVLEADYLFLNTDAQTKNTWLKAGVGDFVSFKTLISLGDGPFPGISISIDEEDILALPLIGTYNSRKEHRC